MAMFALLGMVGAMAVGSLQPMELRCEAMVNPVGVGTANPRLSWKLKATRSGARNLTQTAYEVRVEGRPQGKAAWESGRVESAETYGIRVPAPLGSGAAFSWQVRVWDQNGEASPWSEPATFTVGLLEAASMQAQWIGLDAPREALEAAQPFYGAKWIWHPEDAAGKVPAGVDRTFTKSFVALPNLEAATLRVTADDQFEVLLNGEQVGASDGNADAWKRPVTLDLRQRLRAGENTLEIRGHNTNEGAAGVIAKLRMRSRGGQAESVVTDATWTTGDTAAKVVANFGEGPWGAGVGANVLLPPPIYLWQRFHAGKQVARATAYYSALGLVELRLNGDKVGEDLFVPGWSDYDDRVYVKAVDVTEQIRHNDNVVGLILGDGWYSGYVGFGHRRDHYGTKPRAWAQIVIEYKDGTTQLVATSPEWRAKTGPILESDFLMGERYDARKELGLWDVPGQVLPSEWSKVDVGAEKPVRLEPFPSQTVEVIRELRPQHVTQPKPGVYVLDLGQNIAGFARLKVQGEPGQEITLRFAERLSPDGNIYTTNLRGARAIDTYVCRGGGLETWEPRFTFHGFQYIEVTGLDAPPRGDQVVGLAISTDTPEVGTLETSDPMLNQLVSNAWWTQKMNFIDIPTDCPQRDERLGWTGDAQAYIRTACMLSDVQPFFTKWLVALDDSQREDGQYPMVAPLKVAGGDGGPAWADAGVICPWTIYDAYGDKELLARHYPNMKRFVEFTRGRCIEGLLPPKEFHCFGDWVNIGSPTPNEVIFEAYFAYSTELLARSARVLGKGDEAAHYEALHAQIKEAFNKAYVSSDGEVKGDSQCAYVLAIAFDLLSPEMEKRAAERLVADIEKRGWHLSTGFVGTRDIMRALTKVGRNDVAFRLLHNTTFPSWGFTIKNGATSIWERWDGWTPEKGFQDPGMNSFAHYAFGAVVGWMFDQIGGISNLEAGFAKVRLAPQLDPNLTWSRCTYDSVRGKIVCDWSVKDGRVTMRVVVPPNVKAEVVVPGKNAKSEGLKPRTDGVFEVGSGMYEFTADR